MQPRILTIALVTMLILAVVTLSVNLKDHGTASYQAVNGPTTVFRAFREALLLAFLLLAAGVAVTKERVVAFTAEQTADRSDLLCTMRR